MNFIIYEDEDVYIKCYEEVITKLMGKTKIDYKIYKYNNSFKNNISGNKIYILNFESLVGLDLARKIRNSGDWSSTIIGIIDKNKFKIVDFMGKILVLDYINKDYKIKNNLYDSLRLALKINFCRPTYNFSYKGDYFSLPYDDIIYIEKNLNDNYSIVVCENAEYIVRKTISKILSELSDSYFFKTHRSCIVNISKIKKIDYDKGLIFFDNKKSILLSRSNKRNLKEKMFEFNS